MNTCTDGHTWDNAANMFQRRCTQCGIPMTQAYAAQIADERAQAREASMRPGERRVTNRQASLAPLTRADCLQIALALHTPVEREVQAARYREKSDEELLHMANALFPAIENRTIFLEGEMLHKEGFAQAVQDHYATIYRGMVVAHQLVGHLSEEGRARESSKENTDGNHHHDCLDG
jgi:hypothetical protein